MDPIFLVTDILVNFDIVAAWQMATICRTNALILPRLRPYWNNMMRKIMCVNARRLSPKDYINHVLYYKYPTCAYDVKEYLIKSDISLDVVKHIFTYPIAECYKHYWFGTFMSHLRFDICDMITLSTNWNQPLINRRAKNPCKIFVCRKFAIDLIYIPLTGGYLSHKNADHHGFTLDNAYTTFGIKIISCLKGHRTLEELRNMVTKITSLWDVYFTLYSENADWNIEPVTVIKYAIMFCRQSIARTKYWSCLMTMIIAVINHKNTIYFDVLRANVNEVMKEI